MKTNCFDVSFPVKAFIEVLFFNLMEVILSNSLNDDISRISHRIGKHVYCESHHTEQSQFIMSTADFVKDQLVELDERIAQLIR